MYNKITVKIAAKILFGCVCMKRTILLSFIASVFLLALILSGCTVNQAADEEGYVEVTTVRIPEAKVYLSPSGSTSSFQLTPQIFPENATNRKLEYYVDPQYAGYFTVTPTGLIQALTITNEVFPDGIPLKISSTSNKDAYTNIRVFVEYVAVKSVRFAQSEISLLYLAEPMKLDLVFTPYHAQDGRDVTYVSQNEAVGTVSSTGVLTVHGVGVTTVIATGNTLEGDTVEARTRIVVSYAKGRYRLEVTNSDPKYQQVLGYPEIISFNIVKLDPQSDPNPDIKWYVGDQRNPSQDGMWQFEYSPASDTPTSYTISAVISAKNEQPITVKSEPVYLYNPFNSFAVDLNGASDEAYAYGQTVELSHGMSSGYEKYRWYIKKKGEYGYGSFIAETTPSVNGGKLNYTVDVDGDNTVIVMGVNDNVTVERREIAMKVVRYVKGDKIIISPTIGTNEMIPDSFDWYLHEVTPSGTGNGVFLKTTVKDTDFTYPADNAGDFVISAIPTVAGKPVTITEGGTLTVRAGYSQRFTVWDSTAESNVTDVRIKAVERNGESLSYVVWSAVGGVDSYTVEITVGADAYIFTTGEDKYGEVFSGRTLTIPSSIASVDEDFSVRVKQNGGFYSKSALYTPSETIKEYDTAFFDGLTGYITSLRQLGELINYVTAYRPASLLRYTGNGEERYAVDLYCPLLYSDFDTEFNADFTNAVYPYTDGNSSSAVIKNFRNLVDAAYNTYGIGFIKNVAINPDGDNRFELILTYTTAYKDGYITQTADGQTLLTGNLNEADTYSARLPANASFNISLKNGSNVSYSEQIVVACEQGRNPIAVSDSPAEAVLKKIHSVLNEYLTDTMSEKEKVLAIFNYLAANVEFDALLDAYTGDAKGSYAGNYLEGVFNSKLALPEGVSKAFLVMCAIEGITCRRINGKQITKITANADGTITTEGKATSWNKVFIDGAWYNVNVPACRITKDGKTVVCHTLFLVSDQTMLSAGYAAYGDAPKAEEIMSLGGWVNGVYDVTVTEGDQGAVADLSVLDDAVTGLTVSSTFELRFSSEIENTGTVITEYLNGKGVDYSVNVTNKGYVVFTVIISQEV